METLNIADIQERIGSREIIISHKPLPEPTLTKGREACAHSRSDRLKIQKIWES